MSEELPVVNVTEVVTEVEGSEPEGYRSRGARIGPMLGAERLGATVYELDPGDSAASSPNPT